MKKQDLTFLGTLYGERLYIETKDKEVLDFARMFLKDAVDCPRCRARDRDSAGQIIGLKEANKIYYPKI